MKNKLLGSILLSGLLVSGFSGCGSSSSSDDKKDDVIININAKTDAIAASLKAEAKIAIDESLKDVNASDKIPFGDGSFSPFERVAILPLVEDADGNVDYNATNKKIKQLAAIFADYVANTNEPKEDNATFKGANWIVAGVETSPASAEDIAKSIIQIPTKKPINPNFKTSKTNTKKVQVVEICNKTYASKALGVINVGGEAGTKVPNGIYHATALPCEVTIYYDDKAIYVDLLNPETIFTLFFTEVFTDDVMNNEAFKSDMMALPTQVKDEITAMVYNSFDAKNEQYSKTSIKMGPVFSSMSKALAVPQSAAPYAHYSYRNENGEMFTSADAKAIAQKLINVMTIHGSKNAGKQESPLFSILPSQTQTVAVNPQWRSARHEPLKVPGGSWIIEACSPVYAKEALATGEFHTPALPCEVAVFVSPDNNETIEISYLNPDFMFKGLFADGMADMNQTTIEGFQNIIDNINGDLRTIVDYALENNVSEINQDSGREIFPISY